MNGSPFAGYNRLKRRPVMRRWASGSCAAVITGCACVLLAGCTGMSAHCKVPLEQSVAIPTLQQVCPSERTDALCKALRLTSSSDVATARKGLAEARSEAARSVAQRLESNRTGPWDAAVRYYVRERIVNVLAWYVITRHDGSIVEPADYEERVSKELFAPHFPAYPPNAFRIAALWLPPLIPDSTSCAQNQNLLLILPGVVRTLARNEFDVQIKALKEQFPCIAIERVNTLTFEAPTENAKRLREVVARYPDINNVHLFGYSQGGLNILKALVEYPEIATRVRTVTFLDVPAHGSEVAEALYHAIAPLGWFEWLWPRRTLPGSPESVAKSAFGIPPFDAPMERSGLLEEWLRQEGAGETSLAQLLRDRREGVRSLGTSYAREFWAHEGTRLPETPLYAGFRAIITDPSKNLPPSNIPLYEFTNAVEPREPYNDMQVRVVSQEMGGPLTAYEVLGPVAEGNHWQWALVPGDVPDTIMPAAMTENMPHSEMLLAYYATYSEIGLMGRTAFGL